MKEYNKNNIIKTTYSIVILDACGNVYEEVFKDKFGNEFLNIRDCAYLIIEMKKTDKELGKNFGVWDYRICEHEEDNDTDWQTVYKLFKYKGHYKVKVDERF